MTSVIIINGYKSSGKDTFVEFCTKYHERTKNISTIDSVKNIATMMGWDGTKDNKSRDFLANLKALWTNYNDGIFKDICATINKLIDGNNLVFVHCREPEEIDRFVKQYKSVCKTVFVDRKPIDELPTNASDNNVRNYNYDHIIDNNGTLEDLDKNAVNFILHVINH